MTPSETVDIHTRLLRCGLACEDTRVYWDLVTPGTPAATRAEQAFEARLFGSRSLVRVEYLLRTLDHRFSAFPQALDVLRRWRPADPVTRQAVCHWHLQLADPTYRAFTGALLAQRRLHPEPTIDRDVAARWVEQNMGRTWASATTLRMATALLTAASDAGLCPPGAGPRPLAYPRITDEALAYLLYLLRETRFEGTLLRNPYLASVGLVDDRLDVRLARLPGIQYHRQLDLHDLGFEHPDLATFARERLPLGGENP